MEQQTGSKLGKEHDKEGVRRLEVPRLYTEPRPDQHHDTRVKTKGRQGMPHVDLRGKVSQADGRASCWRIVRTWVWLKQNEEEEK